MNEYIPYGRQDISEADINSVIEILRSDWLTQGPTIPRFEESVAKYCGASYALAMNSATSALHVACLALGLGKGDYLWTSPNTFVASANCGLYCGAQIDFVDIDSRTYNMSVEKLEEKLVLANKNGKLPKIVIPVHFAGQSCEMKKIQRLANQYGFKIIEDASHAIGGKYLGDPIGNCRFSDITIFSFHPVKIITTGEGGMAMTNNSALANKMALLRSHGITRDESQMTHKSEGGWYYQQIDLGYNYRMTDMQGALGLSQMNRLDSFISYRKKIAKTYDNLLSTLPILTPYQHEDTLSSYHLYVIRLDKNKSTISQADLYTSMRANGLGVNIHYNPVYRQPYYERLGFKMGYCSEAEMYYSEVVSIPIFPSLTNNQLGFIVESISSALK